MNPFFLDLYFKIFTVGYMIYSYCKPKEFKFKYFAIKSLTGNDNLINLLKCIKFDESKKDKMFIVNIYNDHSTVEISLLVDTFFELPRVNVISASENIKGAITFTNNLDIVLDETKMNVSDLEEVEYEGFYISVKET